MKVIMTGGGTGGHIYPAIAIADELKKRDENIEILFVGAERGLEKKLVPERGYDIELITIAGINRRNPFKNIDVVRKLIKGSNQAKKIIKDFQPDFVVGTGGYASAPLVRQAQNAGVPSYIHEQNAFPGVTNKMLEKKVNKVFLGFEKAGEYFKEKDKQVVVGNPVRDEFMQLDRAEARKSLGFTDEDFVILAFGGSQGAGRINKAMMSVIKEFNNDEHTKIVLGTGSYYYDAILHSMQEDGFQPGENISILEYIHDMAKYLVSADLVISRSGALTVAETTVSGAPAIFIPSPIVSGNHQYHNAMAVAEKGGAIVIEEKDLTNELLIEKIREMRNDQTMMAEMAEKSKMCGPREATKIICDIILEDYTNGEA